ncbi:MAG: hypothetical protein FJ286_02625 [Planctomycetes bacterium]|nr:hypothetical protein [Planctomycetota bacterium]
MITIDWHPSPTHLRRWAVTIAASLGVSGALFRFVDWGVFRAGHDLAPLLWGFAAVALVTAGTGTRLGLPAYWAWMGFVWLVGTALGIAALAAVFFLVVTPLGLAARVAGRDRLGLRRPPPAASLWRPLPQAPHDPARQF